MGTEEQNTIESPEPRVPESGRDTGGQGDNFFTSEPGVASPGNDSSGSTPEEEKGKTEENKTVANSSGVGRPTLLTKEIRAKIQDFLKEKTERPTLANVSEYIGIEYNTFKQWIYVNYEGLEETWNDIQLQWKLKKANENINEFLTMDDEGDAKLKKIKADITTFVAETLGKKHYSKRTETTGAEGGAIKHEIDLKNKTEAELLEIIK